MKDGDTYFIESYTTGFLRKLKIDKLYFQGETKYQTVLCFSNQFLGKALFLDEKIQSAQIDEFIYHEALVQPVLCTHPDPKEILVIGGGEGATLREVLRHDSVQKATMVDIDEELVQICKEYLPEWSEGAFTDPRIDLKFMDARSFVEDTEKKFDIVISDLTEPLEKGPSVFLFTKDFFEGVHQILNEEGIFVLQAGSTDPVYSQFFTSCVKTLEAVYSCVRPYWTFIVSFSLPWGFVLASKKEDPLEVAEEQIAGCLKKRGVKDLKFYHPGLHRALFALPLYLEKGIREARMLTDKKPFIWEV
ncbi:MAG: polyamine aminopropyltransferase [Candidatus Aminicenantes bacterium]